MTIFRNFWLISPSVTINFSKMITNPSHQTDSRRATKDVDICYKALEGLKFQALEGLKSNAKADDSN